MTRAGWQCDDLYALFDDLCDGSISENDAAQLDDLFLQRRGGPLGVFVLPGRSRGPGTGSRGQGRRADDEETEEGSVQWAEGRARV